MALSVAVLGACYGPDAGTTDGAKSKPELSLEFPASTSPGSSESAELTITNPGPEAMDSIVVAFSRLGDPELPQPVVDVVGRNEEGAVEDVTPKPNAVSPDGIIYTFDGIAEGESLTVTFTLVVPQETGPAGNAILVYEGQDPDRARGVRLETEVGG